MKSSFLSTVLRQPGANHHSPCSLGTSSRYVTHVGTQKLSEFWFMYCISVMTVTQKKLQCFAQEWRTFRHQCFKLVFFGFFTLLFWYCLAWLMTPPSSDTSSDNICCFMTCFVCLRNKTITHECMEKELAYSRISNILPKPSKTPL